MSRFLLAWVLITVFFGAAQASAFELSLVGATNFTSPSINFGGSTATGYTAKAAFGGGALLGFGLLPGLELELGGLYLGRHYTYPISSGMAEDSFNAIEVPILLRITALKYITIGGGGYYARPTGQETYTVTPTGGSGQATTSSALDTFKPDFGAVGSVQLRLPLNFAANFLIDGRYAYGLTNASKIAGETLKFREAQALFGLNFGF